MFQDGQRAALRGSAKLCCHFSLGPSWGAVRPNTVTTIGTWCSRQCSQVHPESRSTTSDRHIRRRTGVEDKQQLIKHSRPCISGWMGQPGRYTAHSLWTVCPLAPHQSCTVGLLRIESHIASDEDFFHWGTPGSRQGGPATAELPRWSFLSGDRSSVASPGLTQGRLEYRQTNSTAHHRSCCGFRGF